MRKTRSIASLVLILSTANLLFAVGLFSPSMVIKPGFGQLTTMLSMLKPEIGSPKSISIFSGILDLFSSGSYFVAIVILIFSVLFPLWKFAVCWNSLAMIYIGKNPSVLLSKIEKLGKYSMIDIYVFSLILLAIKGLPGGTSVHLSWGVVAFTLAVIISMFLPGYIHKTWDRACIK